MSRMPCRPTVSRNQATRAPGSPFQAWMLRPVSSTRAGSPSWAKASAALRAATWATSRDWTSVRSALAAVTSMPSIAAYSAALPAFPVIRAIRSSIGAFLLFFCFGVWWRGVMPGRVVLRVMDVELVAGEAADTDDGLPGQVAAAATDGDGIAVPDGAAEFPPPQMPGGGCGAGGPA